MLLQLVSKCLKELFTLVWWIQEKRMQCTVNFILCRAEPLVSVLQCRSRTGEHRTRHANHVQRCSYQAELETKVHEVFTITEKAPC